MPGLMWNKQRWFGFLDIVPREYDEAYFEKYVVYKSTDLGRQITQARMDFVSRFYSGRLIDIGIGSGHFVDSRPETYGFDVNPTGIAWLKKRGLYADPMLDRFLAYTFFDSFEHIKEPGRLLDTMPDGALLFTSIPIFNDADHVLRSKHYRPDEHYWYFTAIGFVLYMLKYGFHLVEADDFETRLGREDIMSFAFIKRGLHAGHDQKRALRQDVPEMCAR